jgi:CxxC-x17-CxxC domain-containing protein
MRNFGGDHKFGGRPGFGGRSHDKPVMHQATCSKCGKDCEVPFRPSGTKPVLCRDCFRSEGGGQSGFQRKSFDRPSAPPARLPDPRPLTKELEKVNEKLDKILKLLEPPTEKLPSE